MKQRLDCLVQKTARLKAVFTSHITHLNILTDDKHATDVETVLKINKDAQKEVTSLYCGAALQEKNFFTTPKHSFQH